MRTTILAVLLASLVLASAAGGSGLQGPSGTIALTFGGRSIVLISLPAGTTRIVTAPDEMYGAPALSPDGRRIAIAGDRGIWVMNSGGSQVHRIIPHGGVDVAWSPNSRSLAFVRNGALLTVSAAGKHLSHLTGHAEAPAWSAGGRRILFVRNPAQSSRNGALYSIGADGHGLRRLVAGRWYAPRVAPNGTRLVFFRNGSQGIYVAPARGGTARLLLHKGTQPEWSPDSRFVAFTREVSCTEGACNGRVFVAPAGGGTARPYGPVVADLGPFSWSR